MATTPQAPALLTVAPELLQRIFLFALKQRGTLELQYPGLADQLPFHHALFAVSRAVRAEALQAFYETNTFLWVLGPRTDDMPFRIDPTNYPPRNAASLPMPQARPWEYPDLMRRLRWLNLSIYLPGEDDWENWDGDFPQRLERLVELLDAGVRLAQLHVMFRANRSATGWLLDEKQLHVLEILARMRVRGTVTVVVQSTGLVKESIASLDLARRMKG